MCLLDLEVLIGTEVSGVGPVLGRDEGARIKRFPNFEIFLARV